MIYLVLRVLLLKLSYNIFVTVVTCSGLQSHCLMECL